MKTLVVRPSNDASDSKDPLEEYKQRTTMAERVTAAQGPVTQQIWTCLESTGIVGVLAEEGMGKTTLLRRVAKNVQDNGGYSRIVNLGGMGQAGAVKKARYLARDVGNYSHDCGVFIGIDGVPSMDEHHVGEFSKYIRSLYDGGCKVLLCFEPESDEVLLGFPNVMVFDARDLSLDLRSLQRGFGTGAAGQEVYRRTNGIPALACALETANDGYCTNTRFWHALERIVRSSLREGLLKEERSLRLAMVFLGRGTFDDVRFVAGKMDRGVVDDMARETALFGIDMRNGTFCCDGVIDEEGLAACAHVLGEVSASYQSMLESALLKLVERGDYARAGCVATLGTRDAETALLFCDPVEFVNVGHTSRLRELVRTTKLAHPERVPSTAQAVLNILDLNMTANEDALRAELEDVCGGSKRGRVEGQVRALYACREAARTTGIKRRRPMDGKDALTDALLLHVRAHDALVSGNFEHAFRMLLAAREMMDEDSLSAALLAMDFEIARVLAGDTSIQGDDGPFARAGRFLDRSGCPHLAALHHAIEPALTALCGATTIIPGIDRAMAAAMGRGDCLDTAMLEIAAAIYDLACASGTRAHIRAKTAFASARRGEATYLVRVARLLDDVAVNRLGDDAIVFDPISRQSMGRRGPNPIDVIEELYCAARGSLKGGIAKEIREVLAGPCPRDALWLLNLLVREAGETGTRMRDLLPGSWLASVDEFDRGIRRLFGFGGIEAMDALLNEREEQDGKLHIMMLGGPTLMLNGQYVELPGLERRAAKSMLLYLAAVRGHRASRGDLIEAFWTRSSYANVRQKVYEATSVARATLKKIGIEGTTIATENGYVMLNPRTIVCDVDEFEDLALEIVTSDADDQRLVTLGGRMMRLYEGDLFVTPGDASGVLVARREELRNMFVDAMLRASEAAMRLGMTVRSLEFTSRLKRYAGLREDAMAARLRALHQAGRSHDCTLEYEDYSHRVIDITGAPPSAGLRKVAGEVQLLPVPIRREEGRL